MLFRVDHIPPSVHLEDVGALVETVSVHVHEHAGRSPVQEVFRDELGDDSFALHVQGGDEHVPDSIVGPEYAGVPEVVPVITELIALDDESRTFEPVDEIVRGRHHDDLPVFIRLRVQFVPGVEIIIQAVIRIENGRAGPDGRILAAGFSAGNQFPHEVVIGEVGGLHAPDGMENARCPVRDVVLEIHDLEIMRLRIVEGHRVADIAVVRLEEQRIGSVEFIPGSGLRGSCLFLVRQDGIDGRDMALFTGEQEAAYEYGKDGVEHIHKQGWSIYNVSRRPTDRATRNGKEGICYQMPQFCWYFPSLAEIWFCGSGRYSCWFFVKVASW